MWLSRERRTGQGRHGCNWSEHLAKPLLDRRRIIWSLRDMRRHLCDMTSRIFLQRPPQASQGAEECLVDSDCLEKAALLPQESPRFCAGLVLPGEHKVRLTSVLSLFVMTSVCSRANVKKPPTTPCHLPRSQPGGRARVRVVAKGSFAGEGSAATSAKDACTDKACRFPSASALPRNARRGHKRTRSRDTADGNKDEEGVASLLCVRPHS